MANPARDESRPVPAVKNSAVPQVQGSGQPFLMKSQSIIPPFYSKIIDRSSAVPRSPSPGSRPQNAGPATPPVALPPVHTGHPPPTLLGGQPTPRGRGDNAFAKVDGDQLDRVEKQGVVASKPGPPVSSPIRGTTQLRGKPFLDENAGKSDQPRRGTPVAASGPAGSFIPQGTNQPAPPLSLVPIIVRPDSPKQPSSGFLSKPGFGFDLPTQSPRINRMDGFPPFGHPSPIIPPTDGRTGERTGDAKSGQGMMFQPKTPVKILRSCQVCGESKEEDMMYTDVPCKTKCVVCKGCLFVKTKLNSKCPICNRLISDSDMSMIRAYGESMSAIK